MRLLALLLTAMLAVIPAPSAAQEVPISGLGRLDGWRDNSLIGYGLVTGLAGSGDTRRSGVTRQALQNVLSRLGTNVTEDQISSRNVAVVMVTAVISASANVGDRIDANVSSIGDARSLAGGTLLMTPLLGPDQRPYALAQGSLTVGGYNFEANLNAQQRNYPTSGTLPGGAMVETPVDSNVLINGEIGFLLTNPNFATAQRIADRVNQRFGFGSATVRNADDVRIRPRGGAEGLAAFIAEFQALTVSPERTPRIVINERTGTIVAGSDVRISSVVISQGDIRVTVRSDVEASQPSFIGGFASDVRSLAITNTDLTVEQDFNNAVVSFPNSTVADLAEGLARARIDTRRTISILQAMKAAGALHAEIVVQ
ncbi:flagellar basal body P-ring protein FlgI [Novosphingopyxis sp.]|uniref:flagellar basal body P-ring protein FlgI n=1 Tax=Novosphingopyxis sp. TaxID=2709690 RepID=UPI003B5A4E49